jgi:hypothetical protein
VGQLGFFDADRQLLALSRPGSRFAAAAIQDKHGSRKSGIPMTGQNRRAKPKASRPTSQLKLDP